MISMKTPGVAQMIQVVLLNLIQVDILQTDKWVQQVVLDKIGLLAQDYPEDPTKYNYFKDNGYQVDYLLGNLGSTLVFLALFPVLYLLLGLINLLGKCSLNCTLVAKSLNKLFLWDFALSFYMSQFTPVVLAYLLNLRKPSDSSLIESTSALMSYILAAVFTLMLPLLFYSIRRAASLGSSSSLTEGLRDSSAVVVRYWRPMVLARLYFTLVILVYMQDIYIV